jgi:hypothetical protein
MVELVSPGATTLIIKKLRMSLDDGGDKKSQGEKKAEKRKIENIKDALENTL